MTFPFGVGKNYSRKDVYRIMNVPRKRQGGNRDTGYNRFNNDWFIFANVNTFGRTGHRYNNRFIGNELEWYAKKRYRLHNNSIQSMLNPIGHIYIFAREDSSNTNFTYIGNGHVKRAFDEEPVRIIWQFTNPNENHPEILPAEVSEPERFVEGAIKQISVNIYERNPIARKKCIEHFGLNCSVCSFNFFETYGEIGKDFIHVHHLLSMHEIGEEYNIDPTTDLRPVCPNCHAMLHKKTPAYTIEELKKIVFKQEWKI